MPDEQDEFTQEDFDLVEEIITGDVSTSGLLYTVNGTSPAPFELSVGDVVFETPLPQPGDPDYADFTTTNEDLLFKINDTVYSLLNIVKTLNEHTKEIKRLNGELDSTRRALEMKDRFEELEIEDED